jgi:hypothetical protein
MSSGSVKAQFNFISYQIDSTTMKMNHVIKYLLNKDPILLKDTNFSIKLRSTEIFNIDGSIIYIVGLTTKITILHEEDKKAILTDEF